MTLPEGEGGLACTTSAEVLDAAFIGSAGAAARWYSLNDEIWPEAAALYRRLSEQTQLQGAVDSVTLQFEEAEDRSKDGLVKLPVLDPARLDLFLM